MAKEFNEAFMNRPRAKKADSVTQEMWNSINPFNKRIAEEFLNESTHLSKQSMKQYPSALKHFFWWVKTECNDKQLTDITSRDYLRYQNYLTRRGLSERGIKFKRSVVSSLNQYVMLYYEQEYPTFKNFVTKQIKVAETGFVYKKLPPTKEELDLLYKKLEEMEEWQKIAYLKFTFSCGCRREESRQIKKDIVNAPKNIKTIKVKDENGKEIEVESISYKTPEIRCKGKSEIGKPRKLQFDEEAMIAIKKWLEVRGEDDCPYLFVTKYGGKIKQVSETTFEDWCSGLFSDIIGRRFHPHILREARATDLVVNQGKNIEVAQKLLGHNSSETTNIYVIREDSDDADEAFI